MSLQPQQSAFVIDLITLIAWVHQSLKYDATIGEVYRTAEQEALYVKSGKSQTMDSGHLRKMAADVYFFDSKGGMLVTKPTLALIVQKWKSLSPLNIWGGDWTSLYDYPHFERKLA